MISIILSPNPETVEAALAQGFCERTVLVKESADLQSNSKNKSDLEGECFKLRPFQFLVSDYWGACLE